MAERIVIAEDDEDLAFVLREALIRNQYEVEIAPTAGALLDRLRAGAYDLVLLDVKLPDMDGLDALPKCRELAPETPIIVMTAHGTRQIAMEAITRGAYDFFTKPLKMAEFQVVVARALDRRRLQQQVKVLRAGQPTGFGREPPWRRPADIMDMMNAGNDQERERLKFNDNVAQGDLYKPWKPFKHPQFGDIEIGGWVKMSSRLPHPFMLNDLVHRNASAVLFAAAQTPVVSLKVLPPVKAGADLYRVRVRVVNGGSLPSLTYNAVQRKLHPQDMLKVSGPAVKVVAGGRVTGVPIETVAYKTNRPELQFLQVPGDGKLEFEFLVSGKGELTFAYQSLKAGKAAKTVTLQ